jgi:Flp pilus assembly protein TadG
MLRVCGGAIPRLIGWCLPRHMRRFGQAQDGAVTVEFVILLPLLLYVFMMGFELGLLNVRHLFLHRATDLVARDIQISTKTPPTYDELKQQICDRALFQSDCIDSIRIEMRALPLADWADATRSAACVDREESDSEPTQNYQPGQQNDLMLIRVCRLFEPIFPGSGLGHRLDKNSDDEYGLIVFSGFVSEPVT